MSYEKWVSHTLEEVADIVGGGTPSTTNPEFWGDDISWITPKDMAKINERYVTEGERAISTEGFNNSSARLLPKGTVLLTSRAPIGYLGIAKNEIATNQGFKSLIPKPNEVDSLFLFYLLKNNIEYIKSLGSGTTFAEISGGVLKQVVFDFPPLGEHPW
jgi:type I restriction enzyme S subunit